MNLFSKYVKDSVDFFSVDMFINVMIEKNCEEDIRAKSFIDVFEVTDVCVYEIK